MSKGKRLIKSFDYHGVTLGDGRMRHQFDLVKDYYLAIANDDLLHGYRERAGLPAPGIELGGWYTGDAGNVFPQIMAGFARMYAATGDKAVLDKANYLLKEWAKCIAPDGYFFYSTHPTSKQYYYEKVVGMLVDMYIYCGNTDTLEYLKTVTDWAEKNMDRTRDYANAEGNPKIPCHAWGEWYTVSENLYRAYLLTGDTRYKDFAEVWEYTEFWDIFAKKGDIFGTRENGEKTEKYHAYSHVNTFSSAAAAYLAKGDEHYLNVLKNAYDFLQQYQTFATGGYGPDEWLYPRERFATTLQDARNHCEIQCGSWAGFKISKYLMTFTGDAKYGDWVERMAYNLIGADIPMNAEGKVNYYAYYHQSGAAKKLYPDSWACCTGTRPQVVADYHDQIFLQDDDSLYVSLYAPSTLTWNRDGNEITVSQRTRFPEESTVEFEVSAENPTNFALKLRVPGWITGPMTAKVNGKPEELKENDLHWAVIEREWKNGDKVLVNIPMKLWLSRFMDEQEFPVAIMHGPVVLALRSQDGDPSKKVDFTNLEESLVPLEAEPLTYHLTSDPNVLIRPLYAFKEGEQFFMYLDPTLDPTIDTTEKE